MKERPIIFSGPMIRAILAGKKTQTRRVVTVPWYKSQRALPYEPYWCDEDGKLMMCDEYGDYYPADECMHPYGVPGDRLWVKETYCNDPAETSDLYQERPLYRATTACPDWRLRWTPSIYMPRWASRITLELEAVRIERLQAISEEDAIAEGCEPATPQETMANGYPAIVKYHALWDSINAKREGCSWADNPWVWALTFHRFGAS